MKALIALAFALLASAAAFATPAGAARQTTLEEATAAYADLLAKYGSPRADGVNGFDYAGLNAAKADRARLDETIRIFAAQRPSQLARDEAFAYWANLYNALTLKVVADAYPIASIRDIKSRGAGLLDFKAYFGPWREKRVTVEGAELSLDDIEHGIMRPTFKDARVHYAVNCASIGCPNLRLTPWKAETLEADLEAAARAFVNHDRGARIEADGRLIVSSIYSWFEEDFGGRQAGVIAHLKKYAGPELLAKLQDRAGYDGHDYDWSLNAPDRTSS